MFIFFQTQRKIRKKKKNQDYFMTIVFAEFSGNVFLQEIICHETNSVRFFELLSSRIKLPHN